MAYSRLKLVSLVRNRWFKQVTLHGGNLSETLSRHIEDSRFELAPLAYSVLLFLTETLRHLLLWMKARRHGDVPTAKLK